MPTMNVPDFAGVSTSVAKVANTGRTDAAISLPVVVANEDKAVLDAMSSALSTLNGLVTTQAGYLDGLEGAVASTNTKLDTLAGYLDQVEGKLDTLHTDATATRSTLNGAYAALTSALTTELNSLANNANTPASSLIDNTTLRHKFMDLELVIAAQGVARSAGATIPVYMTVRLDGTNFGDTNEDCAILAGVFALDAATTARRCAILNVPVPAEQFKLFARNRTGPALAASGSTIKYRLHSDALV